MSALPNENDLVVVAWANPAFLSGRSQRVFETISKAGSRNPVAWRLSYLETKWSGLLPAAYKVFSEDDLRSWMSEPLLGTCSRQSPLLVPLPIARSVLGWQEFDVWDGEHTGE